MSGPLVYALILMGFTFTVAQVAVLRELLVIFLGNELSIAIVLGNWLILEAAGSFFLGKRIKFAVPEKAYALLQFLLSLFLPLTIFGIRCLREIMGLSIGEGASLLQIFFWTVLILAPLGIVDGILFALGCALHADFSDKSALSVGKVYLLEGLGAGAGGIIYTLLFIPLFNTFETALLVGAANLISGILLLSLREEKGAGRKALTAALWSFLVADILLFALSGAQVLERASLKRQWRGLEILASRWSPYGNVTVARREEQITFFSSGMPAATAPIPNIAFAEEMVHYPLLSISAPGSVLVIGGGPGGIIAEALKHPAAEVHYTEIDPLMIRMMREHLAAPARGELENPRVRIHSVDGRLYVKTATRRFDAVLLNLPLPSTLELNRFYTVEFFSEIGRILAGEGILALHLPGSETYVNRETRDLNVCIINSLQAVFPAVYVIPGNTNFILAHASKGAGPPAPERLIERLREREISTLFFRERQIRLKLDARRLKWLEDSLERGGEVKLNRDAHPRGLYYGLAYWNAQFHPRLQVLWMKAADLRLRHLSAFFLVLLCAALALRIKEREIRRKGALVWITGSTGFFGMSTSVLIIFAFQTLHGYAYQWIGLLIAFFMAGLAWGSWIMNRNLGKIRNPGAVLISVEALVILFAALAAAFLASLYSPGPEGKVLRAAPYGFIPLSALAGFFVGLEFPLAGFIFSISGEGPVRTGGTLYAADLFGAFTGALLAGVILIPLLGVFQTCGAIVFLKAGGLVFILLSGSGLWKVRDRGA